MNMKKIFKALLLPAFAILGACSNDVVDDLSGTYDDVCRINLTTVKTLPTVKLAKGVKRLNMEFTGDDGSTVALGVFSTEWTLQPGDYTPARILMHPKQCNTPHWSKLRHKRLN